MSQFASVSPSYAIGQVVTFKFGDVLLEGKVRWCRYEDTEWLYDIAPTGMNNEKIPGVPEIFIVSDPLPPAQIAGLVHDWTK